MSNYKLCKGTVGSAGYDIVSPKDYTIPSMENVIIETDLIIDIPLNYVGFIKGRSGLGFKHDIVPFEGVIDSDYTGYINVKLYNFGKTEYKITKEDRIAQIVILPHFSADIKIKDIDLKKSTRGSSGFGSTGY